MKLPIKAYAIDSGENELDELILTWMSANRQTVHMATLQACLILMENPKQFSQPIIDLYLDGLSEEQEELLAEIGVDQEGAWDGLDECQKWFVEQEMYEEAAAVVVCKKHFEEQTKNNLK